MPYRERINYNIAIVVMGVVLLISVIGAMVLAFFDKSLPSEIATLIPILGGALAVLVPSPLQVPTYGQ